MILQQTKQEEKWGTEKVKKKEDEKEEKDKEGRKREKGTRARLKDRLNLLFVCFIFILSFFQSFVQTFTDTTQMYLCYSSFTVNICYLVIDKYCFPVK